MVRVRYGRFKHVHRFYLAQPFLVFLFLLWKSNVGLRLVHSGVESRARTGASEEYISYTNSNCWLGDYEEFQRVQIQKLRKKAPVHVLVYECHVHCGGLGDRISGILSAFYAAVATDRMFVIDSTMPIELRETLTPARVNWDVKHMIPPNASSQLINGMNSHNNRTGVFRALFDAHESGVDVIRLRINRFHIGINLWSGEEALHPYMGKMNRLHTSCCESLHCPFPQPSAAFHTAFNFLFKFSTQVVARATHMQNTAGDVKSSSSGVSVPFVAIHARIGGQSKENTSWNDPKRHSITDIPAFIRCARLKVSKTMYSGPTEPDIVVFSDSADFRHKISSFESKVKFVKDTLIMHVDRSSFDSHEELKIGIIDTFAELYFLSRASCIVGSKSTFSGLAASIYTPMNQSERCFSYFANCNVEAFDFWASEGLR